MKKRGTDSNNSMADLDARTESTVFYIGSCVFPGGKNHGKEITDRENARYSSSDKPN